MPTVNDAYPSRIGTKFEILDRQDPVIHSSGPPESGLTAEQAKSYERDGFLSIPGLFSEEEVEAFACELQRLTSLESIQKAPEAITEPDSNIVRSLFRVHELSEFFGRLCRDERLLNVARYLLNDDVYIHQSRINLKPGFAGKGFYWHSDFETWHVEDGVPRMRMVSCSIALTENNEFNGPLMLIPGSHRHFISCVGSTPVDHYKASLKSQMFGVPDNESMRFLADKGGIVAPKGPPGSVTFFECNTMHGSSSNISPFPRSNVFFVYNAVSNAPREPFSGQEPRPHFIAARENIQPLKPVAKNWLG